MNDALIRAAAESVRTADDYKQWTRRHIRPVLPHGSMLSGLGHLHAGGAGLDYIVMVDCPLEHIESIRNCAGAIDTPIVRRWLSVLQPVYFDGRNPWPETPPIWLDSFRRHGFHNAIAHGMVDHEKCFGTYHCLFQIPGIPCEEHFDVLQRLTPALHLALCRVIEFVKGDNFFAERLSKLTEREREVVHWLGMGKTNAEIAHIIDLRESTVKHHLTHIFDKVGVFNRSQLVRCLAEYEARLVPGSPTRLL
ncbi:MAG: helix-turn-helix transcriptional regulator [Gammaproteobacteria bacterium]|nr:helix-turn-helix transcriptional regulator [Gammaproteobacteria bacterium]